jgi:glycerophosphoryl diester phosphodiesterase
MPTLPSRPLVVAHRGASVDHPENTLASFDAAARAGAEVVELDVRLSADGVAVVVHDPEVSRTTDGRGFVHELSLAELKRLDAAPGRPDRAEVATLREVLDLLSGRAGVDLEIKNIPGEPAFDSPREAALEAALRDLEAAAFDGDVLVSSFNWITIERCRELAPEVPTGFLTIGAVEADAALVYARGAGHRWILPQLEAVLRAGEEVVGRAHADDVLVGTWVADEPATILRLAHLGVDAVATNDPVLAIRTLDAAFPRPGTGGAAGSPPGPDPHQAEPGLPGAVGPSPRGPRGAS